MNINFRETYQSLSTAKLLNIVKQANDYQPEAVLAAIELLKKEQLETDHTEADRIMSDIKNNWIDDKHYVHAISTKIEYLAEPISHPETQLTRKKWINLLMIGFGAYTIWMLAKLAIRWHRLFELNRDGWFSLYDIIVPLLLILTIVGLYKRKKSGMGSTDDLFPIGNYGFRFGYLFIPQVFLLQNSACKVGIVDIDL